MIRVISNSNVEVLIQFAAVFLFNFKNKKVTGDQNDIKDKKYPVHKCLILLLKEPVNLHNF